MASSSKLSLKLLVDNNSKKVLFAEVEKDVIDFLFDLLSLPIATVMKLLSKKEMTGSLGNLYDSVNNLSDTYIQPHQNKAALLNPPVRTSVANVPLLVIGDSSNERKFYTCCDDSHCCVTEDNRSRCPDCGSEMSKPLKYISPQSSTAIASVAVPAGDVEGGITKGNSEGGFVKGVVTYMVMDDLKIKPMSTISSIGLLTQFRVTDLASLREMDVEMAMPEGLKLLEASLRCKTVLTSVFLGSKVSLLSLLRRNHLIQQTHFHLNQEFSRSFLSRNQPHFSKPAEDAERDTDGTVAYRPALSNLRREEISIFILSFFVGILSFLLVRYEYLINS